MGWFQADGLTWVWDICGPCQRCPGVCSTVWALDKEYRMLTLRKSNDRGYADHGWLKSFHSFSFASYHDPAHMGWGNLRVINEDRIEPGTGFGTHGHRDMEIISYVLTGELAHKDNMGNVVSIPPGDIQRMSAGRGVQHSEFNHAPEELTHFLQIWILPNVHSIEPSYEQKTIAPSLKRGQLVAVASQHDYAQAVKIHADATLWAGEFDGLEAYDMVLDPQRKTYVHLIKGELSVNGQILKTGDAALMSSETQLKLSQGKDAEVLVFDLSAN